MRLTKLRDTFVRSAAYERRFLAKNPWDLAMVVWVPLATVLLIWWIFSQIQITDLPIGVIDNDRGPIANTAVRYLEANPNLTVKQLYHTPAAAKAAILQRDIYAIVIIPEGFSRNISSSKPAPIILQVNAQYGTHSGIIQTSVQSVIGTLSAGVEMKRLVKQGMSPSQTAIAYSPIKIQRISLFNAATDYQQFLASTVIPALLHILAMVVGAKNWHDVNNAQSRYQALQSNVELAAEVLRLRRLGLQEGLNTPVEIAQAQTQSLKARTEQAQAAYSYVQSLAALMQSCGTPLAFNAYLNAADIRLPTLYEK